MEDLGAHVSPGGAVAVLGGGWAGLAAAVTLTAAGRRVTVYEAAPSLGGRARRIDHRGLALDNGLHILIGAYRETLALMRTVIGAQLPLHDEPLDLNYPGEFRLRTPQLPAPWHLAAGLMYCEGLSLAERLSALRFMGRMRATNFALASDCTVEQLLTRHRQSAQACRFLWHPLCISALNTAPAQASAQVFLNVLRDTFTGSAHDSRLLLPVADLGALFPEPAAQWLTARGATLRIGRAVELIAQDGDGFQVAHAGGPDRFDAVVCALPPYRVREVAGTVLPVRTLAAIDALRYEPITSIYLQFDAAAQLPQAMLGMNGGLLHWVFDRGRLCAQHGLLGAVISAGGAHQGLDHAALATQAALELRKRFPTLGSPVWHKVVAEKRATFACTPAMQRPDQLTGVPGFFLAGDYTASPYPGTLEAAVRSGTRCARAILGTS